MDYHYRSISDLNKCIVENLSKNPRNLDLIVGVPRSGLLAASMLALHLNCLLTDLEGFLEGRLIETGRRLKDKAIPFDACKRVLILEDSVYSGWSVANIKRRIGDRYPEKSIFYGAVFVLPRNKNLVDIYYDVCPLPRFFEWNFMHHKVLEKSCVTLEGVLCKSFNNETSGSLDESIHRIKTAKPYLFPTVEIGCIITSRPEKYRAQTEAWLKEHDINYKQLVMFSPLAQETRTKANPLAIYKAGVYISSGSALFVESNQAQAQEISHIVGKSVFCVDTRQIINPSFIDRNKGRLVKRFKKLACP